MYCRALFKKSIGCANKISHSVQVRQYHKHFESGKIFSQKCKSYSHQMACDFNTFGPEDEETLQHQFNVLEGLIKEAIQHERSYKFLQKIDNDLQIEKSDHDDELIDFITHYHKQGFSSVRVYNKMTKFLKNTQNE